MLNLIFSTFRGRQERTTGSDEEERVTKSSAIVFKSSGVV